MISEFEDNIWYTYLADQPGSVIYVFTSQLRPTGKRLRVMRKRTKLKIGR